MTRLATLLCLCACSAPHPLASLPAPTRAEDVLAPSLVDRVLTAALDSERPRHGHWRIVGGATTGHPRGGVNPFVWQPRSWPTVGKEFVVEWTSLALSAPIDWRMQILGSTKRSEPIHLGPEHGDYWLLVVPQWVWEPAEGDIGPLTREGGRIRLRWTPQPSDLGTTWYLQLLVTAPGQTPSGYMLSQMIELAAGR